MGVLLQEAHSNDTIPIGFDEKYQSNTTCTLADRCRNANRLLDLFPALQGDATTLTVSWFVDPPTKEFYHVGGPFNNVFGAWPHRYFVCDDGGKLVARTDARCMGPGQYAVLVEDLFSIVEALR